MSRWSEIRIDFFNDIYEVWTVDAWKTDDDNEEGTVIAEIDTKGNIKYLDDYAKSDEYVQECINEFKKERHLLTE